MKYFPFEGARIAYEDMGRGTPVLLIHGVLVADPWGRFKEKLAAKHRVVAVHLPGFGGSDVVSGKVHDSELFARSVCALVNHLGLNEAPVVALSLGTIVATKAAEKRCVRGTLILAGAPTRVQGLLVKLNHFVPRIILRQIVRNSWIREKMAMVALRVNVGKHRDELGWAKKFARKVNETSPEAIADIDYVTAVERYLPTVLYRIPNKKYFMYGEYDKQKEHARKLEIEYMEIKDAGHDVFSDQPEVVNTLVEQYIS